MLRGVEPKHLAKVVLDRVGEKLGGRAVVPEDTQLRDQLLLGLLRHAWSGGVFETSSDFPEWSTTIRDHSEFGSYA